MILLTDQTVGGSSPFERAKKPGPTDPAAVKNELARRIESEVLVELLTGPEFAAFVQERSDQSAD
jgi:hypothetical protein